MLQTHDQITDDRIDSVIRLFLGDAAPSGRIAEQCGLTVARLHEILSLPRAREMLQQAAEIEEFRHRVLAFRVRTSALRRMSELLEEPINSMAERDHCRRLCHAAMRLTDEPQHKPAPKRQPPSDPTDEPAPRSTTQTGTDACLPSSADEERAPVSLPPKTTPPAPAQQKIATKNPASKPDTQSPSSPAKPDRSPPRIPITQPITPSSPPLPP